MSNSRHSGPLRRDSSPILVGECDCESVGVLCVSLFKKGR